MWNGIIRVVRELLCVWMCTQILHNTEEAFLQSRRGCGGSRRSNYLQVTCFVWSYLINLIVNGRQRQIHAHTEICSDSSSDSSRDANYLFEANMFLAEIGSDGSWRCIFMFSGSSWELKSNQSVTKTLRLREKWVIRDN